MSEVSRVQEPDPERERVAAWIDRYYKRDRLTALPGRRERIIEDRLSDLVEHGRTLISRHESVTGEPVWLHRDQSDFDRLDRPHLPPELADVADLLWEQAHGAPPLDQDPIAKRLGIVASGDGEVSS